jgi:hypothetical protein
VHLRANLRGLDRQRSGLISHRRDYSADSPLPVFLKPTESRYSGP